MNSSLFAEGVKLPCPLFCQISIPLKSVPSVATAMSKSPSLSKSFAFIEVVPLSLFAYTPIAPGFLTTVNFPRVLSKL